MKDLDLRGVFTSTYFVSVVLMLVIAIGGLLMALAITPGASGA